ncbi:MAG: Stf0 family sulfotransferase [Chloroflexota bacterium]
MIRPEIVSSVRAKIERASGPLPVPKLAYWLCGTPRTGSNLLRFALRKSKCGHAAEGYHKYANQDFGWGYDESDFTRYTRQMITAQTTEKSGIFGLKIFWEQFQYYLSQCDHQSISFGETLSPHEKVALFFPDLNYVFIRRRNKIRQAISMVKAKQRSAFVSPTRQKGTTPPSGRLRYSSKMITYYLDLFIAQEMLWESFFNQGDLNPKMVWYEDFETQYEAQVKGVTKFLGREPKRIPTPRSEKQADELSETWYQQYLTENPWIADPDDSANLIANRHIKLLRAADGELVVSSAIWWLRFKRLITNPRQYIKRLLVK